MNICSSEVIQSFCNHEPMFARVKVKLCLCCVVPLVRGLSTRWRYVVSLTSRPHYPPGKELPVLMNRILGRHKSRFGRLREGNNFTLLAAFEPRFIRRLTSGLGTID